MKKTVISIVGPTAVGKTSLSIKVAEQFNGEIISGDSMQVYKGMDIGTAKIQSKEMQGIPHHMIDIKEPDEKFSVVDFKQHVEDHIESITARGKLPIIVGGSGFYIQATLYDYHFSEQKRDEVLTKRLEKEMKEKGVNHLHNRLQAVDPEQASKIHPNNYRRVIRALEVYETTGKTMSEREKNQSKESPYDLITIGLEMDRTYLYKQIDARVDEMIQAGLVEEVRSLYDQGLQNSQAMQAIGYKEWLDYIEGKQSLERSTELLKRNSRRYAKRQYTWFKNKMSVDWYSLNPSKPNEVFQVILKDLAGILQKR